MASTSLRSVSLEISITRSYPAVRLISPSFYQALYFDLEWLFFTAALEGQGRVVFVSGEAGRGKTALLTEFAHRAQESHPGLIVTRGNCNAYSGAGDPYLPFRDVLGMLSGDVESRWAAGTITQEHARRLWALMPYTLQALVDDGPDLIDVLVPGSGLVTRIAASAPGMAS